MGLNLQAQVADKEMAAQLNRRAIPCPPGHGTSLVDCHTVTQKLVSINNQLTNHINQLVQVCYRIEPPQNKTLSGGEKEREPDNIMILLEVIQNKLHHLNSYEEQLDRLI